MIKETVVHKGDAQWHRPAYLKLVGDQVVFDCSDGEYGPIKFDIDTLRIFDDGSNSSNTSQVSTTSSLLSKIKTNSVMDNPVNNQETESFKKVTANIQSSKLNALLNQIKTKQ